MGLANQNHGQCNRAEHFSDQSEIHPTGHFEEGESEDGDCLTGMNFIMMPSKRRLDPGMTITIRLSARTTRSRAPGPTSATTIWRRSAVVS